MLTNSIPRPGVTQRKISNINQQNLLEPLGRAEDYLPGLAMACSLQGFPYRGHGVKSNNLTRPYEPASHFPHRAGHMSTGRLHCSYCNFSRVAQATLHCKRAFIVSSSPCNFSRIATDRRSRKAPCCGKRLFLWEKRTSDLHASDEPACRPLTSRNQPQIRQPIHKELHGQRHQQQTHDPDQDADAGFTHYASHAAGSGQHPVADKGRDGD